MTSTLARVDLSGGLLESQLIHTPSALPEPELSTSTSIWAQTQPEILLRVSQLAGTPSIKTLRLVCRSWRAAVSKELAYACPRGLEVCSCSCELQKSAGS